MMQQMERMDWVANIWECTSKEDQISALDFEAARAV